MIRTCSAEDWVGVPTSLWPANAPCGKTYDDFDHSVFCPHEYLPGPSREEIDAEIRRASPGEEGK